MLLTDDVYALITGASKGLGRAFAKELAQRNINLLLVALPGEKLPELCADLKNEFSIKCDHYETDLTEQNSIKNLINWLLGNYKINILINNAGMGGSSEFESVSTEFVEKMLSLNIRALTLITHELLPEIRSHKNGYILNVASMASFSPMAYKTLYSASKVFVLYFTKGLNEELRGTGVSASVVHPGPMRTNRQVIKRIEDHGVFGRLGVLSPEYVACKSVNMMFKRKTIIILGWFNHLCWLGMKTVPQKIRLPFIANQVRKTLKRSR